MTGVLILFQGQITNNLQDNPAEKNAGQMDVSLRICIYGENGGAA